MKRAVYVAIWLLVFTIPWENMIVLEPVGTAARVVGVVAGAIGVVTALIENRLRLPTWTQIGFVFVVWSWFSCLWSIDIERTLMRAFTYTQLWIMAWLIYQYTRDVTGILRAYVLGTYVSAAFTLYAYILGLQSAYLRFAAPGFDPNDLSIYLCLGTLFAVSLAIKTLNPLLKAVYISYVPIGMLAILLTGSRTGVVALSTALLTLLYALRDTGWNWRFTALALGGVVGLVAVSFVPLESIARITTLVSELREGTWNMRILIWQAGLLLFGEHPLLGVGAGAFRTAVTQLILQEAAPHNVFLAVAVEGGAPALFMWIFFVLLSFNAPLRSQHPERWVWIGTGLILVVAFLSLNFEWRKFTWMAIAIAAKAGKQYMRDEDTEDIIT